MIDIGQAAPDFILPASTGKDIALSAYRGQNNVLLVFYPLAFTPVWAAELSGLEGNVAIFTRLNTQILAISVDSVHSARAFSEKLGISSFPLLGDLKKEVCRSYGVLRDEGFSERCTFLVDKEGIVRYSNLSALGQERSIIDYIAAIETIPVHMI